MIFILEFAQILDQLDNLVENFRTVLFGKSHEILDLLVFRFVDYKLVGLIHIGVDLFGEFCMTKQCVVNFQIAVILVLSLFIGSQKLHEVLVGLHILALEPFNPLLSCLDVYLF